MRATKRGILVWRVAMMTVAGLAANACDDSTGPKQSGTQTPLITALPRALTAGETQVRDASNAFSFALLSKVDAAQPTDNVFISPLSASFALGMTMNGAAGETFNEMRSALQFGTMTQPAINASYKSLIDLLLSLDPSTSVKIANAIFYRNSYSFQQTFFDTTSKYFGATVKPLDFNNVPATLTAVNDWANTATNNKISAVLAGYDPSSIMFLLNAIYFKGTWRDQFDAAVTSPATFTPATGGAQTAQLMHRQGQMLYAETGIFQAVDLPYGNGAFAMTVVLPKSGYDLNTVALAFTSDTWKSLTASFSPQLVSLALPKLTLSYDRTMNDDLKALGMLRAFDPSLADFSGMAGHTGPSISFVKQNTFVDMNEEGTEAAAVTVVGVVDVSAPFVVQMRVDRPYLFAIREKLSGTVLFVGKISRMP